MTDTILLRYGRMAARTFFLFILLHFYGFWNARKGSNNRRNRQVQACKMTYRESLMANFSLQKVETPTTPVFMGVVDACQPAKWPIGLNLTAVRSYAHRHKIPSKREYGHTYYSQSHFDELRRTDLISDNRYYTSAQVAEKYGLSKANVGVITKKHHITKVKVGRNNLLVKEEFDKVMAERMAQFGSYRLQ